MARLLACCCLRCKGNRHAVRCGTDSYRRYLCHPCHPFHYHQVELAPKGFKLHSPMILCKSAGTFVATDARFAAWSEPCKAFVRTCTVALPCATLANPCRPINLHQCNQLTRTHCALRCTEYHDVRAWLCTLQAPQLLLKLALLLRRQPCNTS